MSKVSLFGGNYQLQENIIYSSCEKCLFKINDIVAIGNPRAPKSCFVEEITTFPTSWSNNFCHRQVLVSFYFTIMCLALIL